jgi:hypothetical protein
MSSIPTLVVQHGLGQIEANDYVCVLLIQLQKNLRYWHHSFVPGRDMPFIRLPRRRDWTLLGRWAEQQVLLSTSSLLIRIQGCYRVVIKDESGCRLICFLPGWCGGLVCGRPLRFLRRVHL